ncbi:MAG TPA: ABC transporter permease [Terriglobia bacterium]|nr:ABC transporter permease [Terriglobia bacterium]
MRSFNSQFRQVLRRLRRAPMFTLITLATIAVGIGANTAVFSVLEGVLLKPLPYPHPGDLVGVWLTAPGLKIKDVPLGPANYFVFHEQNRTFQTFGAYNTGSATVTGKADPEKVDSLYVTYGTLPALGLPPARGRWFNETDELPGSPDTVMLSWGYWRRKFGGDASLVGRSIQVDGKARQVIGVMPEGFRFLDNGEPALIMPLQLDRSKAFVGNFSYPGLARLKPGATIDQANADVARMLPIVNSSFPPPPGFSPKLFEEARIGPYVRPLKHDVVGDVDKVLWVLMGSIGLVLLIACANVANLLLVRAEGRQQDLAIRAAMGATRGRIAAELLFESLTLSLAGSLLGLGIACVALRVLVAMAPAGLPRLAEIGIDARVLLFTLGVALASSLLFGLVPVFKYAGVGLGTGLREGGRTLSESRERHRARNTLVVVQVALGLVLLISSGLMIRTFHALTQVQPGFRQPAEVQIFWISIPEAEVPAAEKVVRMQEEIVRKIGAIPGVASVGLGSGIPMNGDDSINPVYAEDRAYGVDQLAPLRHFRFVSPAYFKTLGVPLVAGRDFTWSDVYSMRPVVMVSENLARDYWGNAANALGKRVRTGPKDDWFEIVGVTGDVHDDGLNQDAPASAYWPILMKRFFDQSPMVRRNLAFTVRSPRVGSESFAKELRQAVWSVSSNLPLADAQSLGSIYQKSMARASFTLVMLGVAGAMALMLGIVGLYGVIAYSVSQRTREIGIRAALGAQQEQLTAMFVGHGLLLAGVGVACGLGAAFGLMRLMSSFLFKVSPLDPVTYAVASLGLISTAVLASYLPSRRAATVDPVDALRAE